MTNQLIACPILYFQPKVPKIKTAPTDPDTVTFRSVLLTKCQRQFESDKENEDKLEKMLVELNEAPAVSFQVFLRFLIFFFYFLDSFSYTWYLGQLRQESPAFLTSGILVLNVSYSN